MRVRFGYFDRNDRDPVDQTGCKVNEKTSIYQFDGRKMNLTMRGSVRVLRFSFLSQPQLQRPWLTHIPPHLQERERYDHKCTGHAYTAHIEEREREME